MQLFHRLRYNNVGYNEILLHYGFVYLKKASSIQNLLARFGDFNPLANVSINEEFTIADEGLQRLSYTRYSYPSATRVMFYIKIINPFEFCDFYFRPNLSCLILRFSGCPTPGFYGESCSMQCPQNCQEGRCHILDGTCLGCVSGYIGQICDKSKYITM